MATIWIDGVAHEVEAGRNLLETSLSLGLDLPYFCWHPSLGSVGACRQCAVVQYQDEDDTRGRIVMGCMTAVADGARFSLGGDRASDFRRGVVETLMINHPHDCPVCSEGGECHLQDMTVMTGHRDRRFRGRKRTFRNQYLGPLVHHEMNRCITCYRCTRYYRDYAGGTDLAALASRDRVYFGREADGVLESEFAGNLVEVCPTGVFTDRTLLGDYTRKWDLQSAPSVCGGCAVGCNTFPGERYGRLKRVHNRFNAAVNGYFLCDRGRFGHGWVNDPARLDFPAQRLDDGRFDAVSGERALALAGEALAAGTVAAIGSPRASLESNFLLRELAGAGNCAPGVAVAEQPLLQRALAHLQAGPAATPDIAAIEAADAVLILGEDVTASAPRLALALRQSVRNAAYERAAAAGIKPWQDDAVRNLAQDLRSPLYIAHPGGTRLDDVATAHVSLAPGNLAAFGEAVAAALAGLPLPAVPPALAERAAEVAGALAGAQRPLVIAGTTLGSAAILDAAAAVATALCDRGAPAQLSLLVPEANSLGQALLHGAAAPDLDGLRRRAEAGELDTLLVLENDLYRRGPPAAIDALLAAFRRVIVLDALDSATATAADLVLATASLVESEGTLVSLEGRAQRHYPVMAPKEGRRPAWAWLLDLARSRDPARWQAVARFDDLCAACAAAVPALAGMVEAAPGRGYRSHGVRVPRQSPRYSGRTAMHADVSVHEPRPLEDADSPLAYSMEGLNSGEESALLPWVWAPGWNSNQSVHRFQAEVGGPLRGGPAGVRLLAPGQGGAVSAAVEPAVEGTAGEGVWDEGAWDEAAWSKGARENEGAGSEAGVVEHGVVENNVVENGVGDAGTADKTGAGGGCRRQLFPVPVLFGSEPLSARSPGIAELVPGGFVVLAPADAAALAVDEGDGVTVTLDGTLDGEAAAVDLAVRIDPALAPGCAGYGPGLAGSEALRPGAAVSLARAAGWRRTDADLIARAGAGHA